MVQILNIERSLFSIKRKLVASEKIRRLLYIEMPSALTENEAPTEAEVDNHLAIKPVIDYRDNGINNFILINLVSLTNSETSSSLVFRVSAFCNLEYWELDNNKIRLYQLSQEIINILNGSKFNFAGKLKFVALEHELLDSKLDSSGFTMIFSVIEDGIKEI